MAAAAAGVGGAPGVQPVGAAAGVGAASLRVRAASVASTVCSEAAGSWVARAGPGRAARRLGEGVEPGAQGLGGRQVAEPEDEVGASPRREVLDAQQRVVVGDRRPAAAPGAERVGEQRPAGGSRRRRRPQGGVRTPGHDEGGARRARRRQRSPGRAATWSGVERSIQGRPPPRPGCGSSPSSAGGTSGSRSAKFRCTGPGRPSSAVQPRGRRAPASSASAQASPRGCRPRRTTSRRCRTARSGRSSGRRRPRAAPPAGRPSARERHARLEGLDHRRGRFAAAVPEVQMTATGLPVALREAEREEARAALVDVRGAAQPPLAHERQDERGGARARGRAGLADAAACSSSAKARRRRWVSGGRA